MITYKSTRGGTQNVTAAQAIVKGIAEDGGLFVPDHIPAMDFTLEQLKDMNYHEVAYKVISKYLGDFSSEDLKKCIEGAYDSKFDTELIAPICSKEDVHFLELFHGPTLAFKDMALSILPYFMMTAVRNSNLNKEVVILTATSGDTGKAALEGFANVEGTKIIVFFPQEGVSEIQKRQMITQEGKNTSVIGIKGNFDDAQSGVKTIFTDKAFEQELAEKGYMFSSANSINIGRLVPQIVYYFYAYSQLMNKGTVQAGEPMNVVVPTGNFGNILAAYYAKQMGLPIGKLICASNNNKVLYDFFANGTYDRNRDFHITISPSMDILISSNLERLLYEISNHDTDQTKQMMQALQTSGEYTITEQMKDQLEDFYGGYADDGRTQQVIRQMYESTGYLMDTHTAVAYAVYCDYKKETGDDTPTVIASTASPYKFTSSVMEAVDASQYTNDDDFVLVQKMKELIGGEIPTGIKDIENRPVLHDTVCEVNQMAQVVRDFLQLSK